MMSWARHLTRLIRCVVAKVFRTLSHNPLCIFWTQPTSPTSKVPMTKTVMLRVLPDGRPCDVKRSTDVLILPSLPVDDSEGPLFDVEFIVEAGSPLSEGKLWINAPKDKDAKFQRDQYRAIDLGDGSICHDVAVKVPIWRAGVYAFYFEAADKKTEVYYFNVPPNLTIESQFLAFNNINLQTVVSKWIGGEGTAKWDEFFGYVASKGYNMIHFTPLQERGESDSPYSIYDQLQMDPKIFKSNDVAHKVIRDTMKKHKLLSLSDVVLNHTANNSSWLRDHPDAGYNQDTAPHLQAAIELERALLEFDVAGAGLPTDLKNDDDIQTLVKGLDEQVIAPLKLWQYYVFDRDEAAKEAEGVEAQIVEGADQVSGDKDLAKFVYEHATDRKKATLSSRFGNKFNLAKLKGIAEAKTGGDVAKLVDIVNVKPYEMWDDDYSTLKQQIADRIRFLRIADNGPKLGPISKDSKVIENYFTEVKGKDKTYYLANNGWIWAGNPLVDFASDESRAYIRREVIVWGDCVKLRYGRGPEDSPAVWDRMTKYVEHSAAVFDGFRIDNCHSTPLHVGEALLDAARRVNPDLYVVAELFSGSEDIDKIFVERLGITTLIREAMSAWSVGELSRLVHKHGGKAIGSLAWMPLDDFAYYAEKNPNPQAIDTHSKVGVTPPLLSSAPHAMFMDCTHDNEMPAQKRTPEDTLPTAALVAFCSSAIGSVFGCDEIYPKLLDVVGESREYGSYGNGIAEVKTKLHGIRKQLVEESDNVGRDHEMYIHHEGQYITIQRYNARTGHGWFLVARCKFDANPESQTLSTCKLGGAEVKFEFAHRLEVTGEAEESDSTIYGIPAKVVDIEPPKIVQTQDGAEIITTNEQFPPGSIAVFSTQIPGLDKSLTEFILEGPLEAVSKLDLFDLNNVLYKCESEERDASGGAEGCYNIPGWGSLVFAGLEGWNLALRRDIWDNNIGSVACDHLRQGEWSLDYVVNRLDKFETEGIRQFQKWLRERMDAIKKVPFFLRPHFFCLVVGLSYEAARFRALHLMDSVIPRGTNFVQRLAMTSVQMVGPLKSTSLVAHKNEPCMAAGLPHFASDYMRCWGRDVFIAFPGLLLVTGRYDVARSHIIGFGETLKHGLIPNLLDAGRNPRYNARDAVWFYLQALQDYASQAPEKTDILKAKVKRRFPLDDTWIPWEDERAYSYESTVAEIVYEVLSRHAKGISYREHNAGPDLDRQMKPDGFNVSVGVDWSTGFVHGGSQDNCGTWMDKMGESEKAGNKGVPGTPRDGAAVEIQGMLKSCLRWVNQLRAKGLFKWDTVTTQDGDTVKLDQWEKLVQDNFDKCFFIPVDPAEDGNHVIDAKIVNRRGIYKDLFKTGKPYEDYQLRCNVPIAMCAAPELFPKEHAKSHLDIADSVLRDHAGVATLDPSDWNYEPYYDNSEDSDNFKTAKGRSYHQGPPWNFPLGFHLRAYVHFVTQNPVAINERLAASREWIRDSPWAGITELTNAGGQVNKDSSPTQAWSTATLLELIAQL
ncbi:glycogen debranching enzyme [Diutina catenulata]